MLHCKIVRTCTASPPFSPPEEMQKGRPLVEDGPHCHEKDFLDLTARVSGSGPFSFPDFRSS
jgi:hypothetical protein